MLKLASLTISLEKLVDLGAYGLRHGSTGTGLSDLEACLRKHWPQGWRSEMSNGSLFVTLRPL